MFPLPPHFQIAVRRLFGTALLLTACSAITQAAAADAIQIQTPNLPPRQSGTQAPATSQPTYTQQGSTPQATGGYDTQGSQGNYGAQGSQGGYGAQGSQGGYGAQGSQGGYGAQGSQGGYGAQGSQGGYDAQGSQGGYGAQAPRSVLGSQSQSQGSYGAQGSQGSYGAQGSNGPMPTRPSSEGPCRVEVSPDRQTLTFVGTTDALPRHFLPLGEFRAQQVVHSPDRRWAVAFIKLRGQAQFAMWTMDLTTCKEQHSVDLAQAGENATFEADIVTVRFGGKEQKWPLADKRVR